MGNWEMKRVEDSHFRYGEFPGKAENTMKNTAIVLAGGRGSRMKSEIRKQYLLIGDKPVLYYSLAAFQNCREIDEIILVCSAGEEEKCRAEFVCQYGISKISRIVPGGKERCHSVYEGLKAARVCDYVLIHDGARPFITEEILERILEGLPRYRACVVGMPVKDTIKLSGEGGYVEQTLPREKLWTIQTPQSFSYELIKDAYDRLMEKNPAGTGVTDDAMVAESMGGVLVKLIEGSYENIKITTPEDLLLAEAILNRQKP